MLRTWFNSGGPLMWPLLVCSILLAAIIFERVWTVMKVHLTGVDDREMAMKAHRRFLPFFIEVPPAIGLLGTVLGVVQSFHLLDGGGQINGVGSGLAIACTTTIFGVGIAVVAAIANHLLNWMTAEDETRMVGSG
jgi:biopolymer transport protein ExbB